VTDPSQRKPGEALILILVLSLTAWGLIVSVLLALTASPPPPVPPARGQKTMIGDTVNAAPCPHCHQPTVAYRFPVAAAVVLTYHCPTHGDVPPKSPPAYAVDGRAA